MNHPQLEAGDLAAVIRESMAAARQNDHKPAEVAQTVSSENRPHELKLQPDFQTRSDDRYHINDLLRYHDRVFVQSAYRALLKRSPTDAESIRDLQQLRKGDVNKIDLLVALRFSPEGRAKKVQVDGLVVPAAVRRLGQLPLIGYVIRLGIAFVRLPNLVRDQREFGGYVLSQHEQIADFINQLSARIAECRDEVSRLRETLSKQVQALAQQQGEFERVASTQFSEVDRRYDALEAYVKKMNDAFSRFEHDNQEQRGFMAKAETELRAEIARLYLQLQHARSELTLQADSISALSTGRSETRPVYQVPAESHHQLPAESHNLDALYAALEDRFRGARDEIKERFKVYLPYVQDQAPVIDLGCGRGEWLEILSEAGIEARGVDTNRIQIEQCRARSLNVEEGDFIAYLRSLSDASAGTVTGFHIIEHVSLDMLITLLNEILRVLRPGGVVIFETPNPENVLVGSNYFYLDPTHRHPLPRDLAEFLLDSRGFHGIEIINLHPWESARVPGSDELTQRFNDYFYGPMDYAIVGRKVGP